MFNFSFEAYFRFSYNWGDRTIARVTFIFFFSFFVNHCTHNVVEVTKVAHLLELDVGLVNMTIFPSIFVFQSQLDTKHQGFIRVRCTSENKSIHREAWRGTWSPCWYRLKVELLCKCYRSTRLGVCKRNQLCTDCTYSFH